MAFEWKHCLTPPNDLVVRDISFPADDNIPITIHKTPPPPTPKIIELIVVKDEPIVKPDLSHLFPEIDSDTKIPDYSEDIFPKEEPLEDPIIPQYSAIFPGGNGNWTKYLRKNLKYPRSAQRMGY